MGAHSFSILGETITDASREAVLEGDFERGLRILMDGLEGMTYDYAIKVLKGEWRIAGRSPEVYAEEDTDGADYIEQLNDKFSGCFKVDGRYYRPYAVVGTWGPEDYYAVTVVTSGSDARDSNNPHNKSDIAGRSLYYAEDPTRDIVKDIVDIDFRPAGRFYLTHAVLCREVTGFPAIFMASKKTAKEAFDLLRDELAIVGYEVTFPPEGYPHRDVSLSPDICPTIFHTLPHSDGEQEQVAVESEDKKELRRQRDREEVQARIAEQEAQRQDLLASCQKWREEILAQANGDMMEISWVNKSNETKSVTVPRAPFEVWALHRVRASHLAPPWKAISPSGLRMYMDDPVHSDWIIGGGLPLDWMDNSEQSVAASEAMFKIQEAKLNFKIPVLCGSGTSTGEIVHLKAGERLKDGQIGVIKNAGPDFIEAAYDAIKYGGALITEAGGSMAHLATVGREQGLRLVRVADATTKFKRGALVTVNCDDGTLSLD